MQVAALTWHIRAAFLRMLQTCHDPFHLQPFWTPFRTSEPFLVKFQLTFVSYLSNPVFSPFVYFTWLPGAYFQTSKPLTHLWPTSEPLTLPSEMLGQSPTYNRGGTTISWSHVPTCTCLTPSELYSDPPHRGIKSLQNCSFDMVY